MSTGPSGRITGLLEGEGALSLRDLARRLGMDPRALEPFLSLLESKGRIEKLSPACGSGCCGSCSCGAREDLLFYRAVRSMGSAEAVV
jgi:hypothetical protein